MTPQPATASRWAKIGRWADRPLLALLLVTVLWAGFFERQLAHYGGDISRFVLAGDLLVVAEELPPGLTVWPDSWGYDGQFYYRLALEPFTRELRKYGVPLLPPIYRQQRILYPLLAYLLAAGQPENVPLTLVGVNLLALLALGYLGARYAQRAGRHALWGLTLALYPGYIMTLARDLAEIVMALCLVLGLLAMQRQRSGWAGLALTLAVLARETALLLPFGLALAYLPTLACYWQAVAGGALPRLRRTWGAIWRDGRWLTFALPGGVFVLWQLWLRSVWAGHEVQALQVQSNFGAPLLGVLGFARQLLQQPGHLATVWLIELGVWLGLAIVTLLALRRSRAAAGVKVAWGLYLLLLLSLNRNVWVEDYAYLRAATEFYLLSVVILLKAPGRRALWPLSVLLASWAALALDVIALR